MTSAPPSDLRVSPATDAGKPPVGLRSQLAAVVVPFLTARVLVVGSVALATFLHARLAPGRPFESLLGWDADWYRRIAAQGYAHVPHEGLRFFPGFPLAARVLAPVLGGMGVALLVVSNGCSFLYGYLLYRLAVRENLGDAVAKRTLWLAMFTPAAFVLVMGYAESLSGCLLVAVVLAVRDRRWLLAAPLGAALGVTRPTGVVVTVLVALEAARGLRACGAGQCAQRLVAILAPAAGTAAYLAWVGWRFGDALAPIRVQSQAQLRGGLLLDPRPAVRAAASSSSLAGLHPQTVHLVWLLVGLGLLVVCARRLPASFTAYAAALLLLGATARAFTSFERYAVSAVPLLLAAALVLHTRRRQVVALATAPAVMAGYALMAFLHLYIP